MGQQTKQRLVIVGIIVAVIFSLVAYLLSGGGSPPKVESVEVESSDEYVPRPEVLFTLDREVAESSVVSVASFPRYSFSLNLEGTQGTITPTKDLADGVPYELTFYYSESPEDERIEIGAHTFRTNEYTQRRDFLGTLPIVKKNYSIVQISERTIYSNVTGKPFNRYQAEVLRLLENNGISSPLYKIDIDAPEDDNRNLGGL